MKKLTNKEVRELEIRVAEDDKVRNSLAHPGWKVVYGQKWLVTVKNTYLKDGVVTYLCKGKVDYYEIPESKFADYLGVDDYVLRYPDDGLNRA